MEQELQKSRQETNKFRIENASLQTSLASMQNGLNLVDAAQKDNTIAEMRAELDELSTNYNKLMNYYESANADHEAYDQNFKSWV